MVRGPSAWRVLVVSTVEADGAGWRLLRRRRAGMAPSLLSHRAPRCPAAGWRRGSAGLRSRLAVTPLTAPAWCPQPSPSQPLPRCRDAARCSPPPFAAEPLSNSAASAWRRFEKCFLSSFPFPFPFSFLSFFFFSHSPPIQERAKVDAERKELEQLQALYHESKSHLAQCPESLREQLRERMRRVSVSPHPPGPWPTSTSLRSSSGQLFTAARGHTVSVAPGLEAAGARHRRPGKLAARPGTGLAWRGAGLPPSRAAVSDPALPRAGWRPRGPPRPRLAAASQERFFTRCCQLTSPPVHSASSQHLVFPGSGRCSPACLCPATALPAGAAALRAGAAGGRSRRTGAPSSHRAGGAARGVAALLPHLGAAAAPPAPGHRRRCCCRVALAAPEPSAARAVRARRLGGRAGVSLPRCSSTVALLPLGSAARGHGCAGADGSAQCRGVSTSLDVAREECRSARAG